MKIIILGDGEYSKVIQKMIFLKKEYEVVAVLDDKHKQGFKLNGIIHAPIFCLWRLLRNDTKVVVAIENNKNRRKVVKNLELPPECYTSIFHPAAVVSKISSVGYGTVIMPHAVINANAEIGMHCIIKTGAMVEQKNDIGDYTHISSKAKLAGNVSAGEGVNIGFFTTIVPGKHIGSWSVVGDGSTVIESIPAYSKAEGSPARIVERILMN